MKITYLFFSIFALSLYAESFESYKTKHNDSVYTEQQAFSTYKLNEKTKFNDYVKELDETYATYKKELSVYWKEPKLSSQKKWVNYTKDKKTRTTVGFDTNTIVIETIATSSEEANKKLKIALATVVVDDTRSAVEHDELQQKIAKVEKKNKKLIVDIPIKAEQILAPVIFINSPTTIKVINYVDSKIKPENIDVKTSKIDKEKVYSVTVKLPSDTMLKRSRSYEQDVRENADRFDIPAPLVFAVMHTESSFNPFARSHVPAYGLMQIVPRSAGVDTYVFLHKEKKMPTVNYLYNSANNIEMGSAYLNILYYRYLKSVKNPTSRLYCTIAAYNTGAGNVAYAFVQKNNIKLASSKINNMQPQEVYEHLLKHMKYDEAKNYLKNVSNRLNEYRLVYESSKKG